MNGFAPVAEISGGRRRTLAQPPNVEEHARFDDLAVLDPIESESVDPQPLVRGWQIVEWLLVPALERERSRDMRGLGDLLVDRKLEIGERVVEPLGSSANDLQREIRAVHGGIRRIDLGPALPIAIDQEYPKSLPRHRLVGRRVGSVRCLSAACRDATTRGDDGQESTEALQAGHENDGVTAHAAMRHARFRHSQLARCNAAMRSSSGGCDMNRRSKPPMRVPRPEMPNASIACGSAAGF